MGSPHDPAPDPPVTQILDDLNEGDRTAAERLLPIVYDELRRVATSYMRRQSPGHTLQPTALVNEAFVKLLSGTHIQANDREHFFRLAARIMRQIVVDHARAKGSDKRGSGWARITFAGADVQQDEVLDVLALDEALTSLAEINERKARLVELRVFGGMTIEEAAAALGVSRPTAVTDWRFARAFLAKALREGE